MQRVAQALLGDDAVFHAVHHVVEVLLHVVGEQEHIAAGGDGLGHGHGALFHAGDARHVGRVGDDYAVETHLAPEQVGEQLGGQGGGHDVLLLDARAELAGHGGQGDVAHHDALQPFVDHGLVHLAEGGVPVLHGQVVDAQHQVLVPLLDAVAGEVLAAAGDIALVDALDVGPDIFNDLIGIVAEGAGVDDGVAPVHEYVRAGVEHPVYAYAGRLPPGHIAHIIGGLCAAARRRLRRGGYESAVAQAAVAAVVAVGGDEQGQLGVLLVGLVLFVDLDAVPALPAKPALVVIVQGVLDLLRVQAMAHLDEQLAYLFLQGHGGDGVLYPPDTLVVQVKRFAFQIDHK